MPKGNRDSQSERLFNALIRRYGPELNENVPEEVYHIIRRYNPMYCVDGVPVLSDKPEVILIKRLDGGFLPGWWIVGGRVPKKERETKTLEAKFLSELGFELEISELDYIGRGNILVPENTQDNPKEYSINTPTSVYAVKIKREAVTNGQIKVGDGNDEWKVMPIGEIVEDKAIHPYVRETSAVAVDKVHGKNWRNKLPRNLRRFGYPNRNQDCSRLLFLPLSLKYY